MIYPTYKDGSHLYHANLVDSGDFDYGEEKKEKLIRGLESFGNSGVVKYKDASEVFELFRKRKDVDLSSLRFSKLNSYGWCCSFGGEYYMDSSYGFLLNDKNTRNIGVASFEGAQGTLLMTQIQGFPGNGDLLRGFCHPKFFLSLLESFGREVGIPSVSVLPYRRNSYIFVRDDRRKRMSYDIPAKQMEYIYDEERGVFVKQLN